MTETNKDNPKGNPQDQGGQAGGDPGQTGGPADQSTVGQLSDDAMVELAGGEKVSLGELKKRGMLEADYRRKTAQLAEERRQIEAEKAQAAREAMYGTSQEEESGEEVNPIQFIASKLQRLEAAQASMYLNGEINRLTSKYPDADPQAVFKSCWADTQANIEEEMKKSHERVANARTSVSIDELLKSDEEKKKEYDQKVIDSYLASKKQGGEAAVGGAATGEGSATVNEPEGPPDGFKACKDKLKEELESAKSGDIE